MQTQNLSIAQKYVCILVLSFSILLYESDILQSTSEVGLRQFFDVATRRHCGNLYLRIFRYGKTQKMFVPLSQHGVETQHGYENF